MTQRLEDFGLKTPHQTFWVFGYGSLMWNPGFSYHQARPVRAYGYHRAFAMRSIRHRGTSSRPGLVLALCPGGSCKGHAFEVLPHEAERACAYLLDREIGTYAYRPAFVSTDLGPALTFLPQKGAAQFVPGLSVEEQARTIAFAEGGMGPNLDYLTKTIVQMRHLGLPTHGFEALERMALDIRGRHDSPSPASCV